MPEKENNKEKSAINNNGTTRCRIKQFGAALVRSTWEADLELVQGIGLHRRLW